MASLKNTDIDATGFLKLPVGTTAERPSSPEQGMIRLATDNALFNGPALEFYSGTEWVTIGAPTFEGVGGAETTDGPATIHTFSSSGTFTVQEEGS